MGHVFRMTSGLFSKRAPSSATSNKASINSIVRVHTSNWSSVWIDDHRIYYGDSVNQATLHLSTLAY